MTQHTQGTPSGGMRRGPIVPYMPGLDGLRALAVIAVIVYHADSRWLSGGFLGVEVFFVHVAVAC
jgi:peptidoglycan/LPS O-acetylase OafA/YrhL